MVWSDDDDDDDDNAGSSAAHSTICINEVKYKSGIIEVKSRFSSRSLLNMMSF